MAQGPIHYSCFKILVHGSETGSGNLSSELHTWPQNCLCQNYSSVGGGLEGRGALKRCTVGAGFVIFFGITCADYLHSRVTLLKQDLAICLVCSQLAGGMGTNMLMWDSTREQHCWKDGWLLPQSTENTPLLFFLNFWHNKIYPFNSHSTIKYSVEEITVLKYLCQLSLFHR